MGNKHKQIDVVAAQLMLRKAMVQAVRKHLDPNDAATFIAVVQASLADVIAQAADPARLCAPGGVTDLLCTVNDTMTKLLTKALTDRILTEMRKPDL